MDASLIIPRFPLVARPRPACLPIAERVQEITVLSHEAERAQRFALASAAFNKAALLASDCGLPDLARTLCWRHADVYLRAQPLGARVARYGLEPLVNLARLRIRSGDGEGAYRLLDSLFRAEKSGSNMVLDGRTVSFEHITGSADDRRKLHQWLWTVLLADGARALASAGRWSDALTQLRRHKGVGARMLDGRQVAVVAGLTAGDMDEAETLLRDTAPGEAWENAVTACLRVLCQREAGRPTDRDTNILLDQYRALDHPAELAVFHTRLGLSVIDVTKEEAARLLTTHLVEQTMHDADGYAARDVLAHPTCVAYMTYQQSHHLRRTVEGCALDHGAIPPDLSADLASALDTSEAVLSSR